MPKKQTKKKSRSGSGKKEARTVVYRDGNGHQTPEEKALLEL
jgi:hypothetical protein